MIEFGGSCGKFDGCCQSGSDDSDGEASTTSGGGSTSVDDSSSVITADVHPLVPTATVTGTMLPPISEGEECTHRTFYDYLYSENNHAPPYGDFGRDAQP